MNPQIERLILLQDLDLMISEFGDTKTANAEKKLGFELGDLETLKGTREELAKSIDAALLRRYDRVRQKFTRAVVPVKDGVCFGCFVRRPAKLSGAEEEGNEIEHCERCGRVVFRYRVP